MSPARPNPGDRMHRSMDVSTVVRPQSLKNRSSFEKCIWLFLFSLLSLTSGAVAAPGDLDPFLGNLRRFLSSPDGTNLTWGTVIALQADGKIVMAGIPDPDDPGFVVARYNSDGSQDMTFSQDGWNLAPFPGQEFVHPRSIEIQA